MLRVKRSKKYYLPPIPADKHLRLRENAFKQLTEREWIFNRVENDLIFLINKNGAYGLVVRAEDIDWNIS